MRVHTLRAELFGRLQVECGDKLLVGREDRDSKLISLFAYLLHYRDQQRPQSVIAEDLLLGEENYPVILKNLIYRLRKLFSYAGLSGDAIVFQGGCYGFAEWLHFETDADRFLFCVDALRDEKRTDEKRMDAFSEAAALYQGDYLANCAGELWVMAAAEHYRAVFEECADRAAAIADASGLHARLIEPLRRAVRQYPYSERLNGAYIAALYEAGQVSEAIRQYEQLAALLLDDLGVNPSRYLTELHARLLSGSSVEAASVEQLRAEIGENDRGAGAYYCPKEVFKGIYRTSVRKAVRDGRSYFLLMCTIRENDGAAPACGDRLREVTQAFHQAVTSSTRSSDVYTRASAAQFVLLLSDITQENCNVVAERLRKNFYTGSRMRHTRLVCEAVSAIDVERLL